MKKQNNFFLLLKQGIKGIFKFRIQFIIIMILAFLSTFILSTSLSITVRLNNSYNQIVKSVPRFDYSTSLYTGRKSVNGGDTTPTFIPLNDFMNFDNVGIYDSQTEETVQVDYNFTLNSYYLQKFNDPTNHEYSFKETFLTRLFEGNSLNPQANSEFKTNFSKLTNDNRDEWAKTQKNIMTNEIILSLKAFADSSQKFSLSNPEKIEEKYLNNTMAGEMVKEPNFIDTIISAKHKYESAKTSEEKEQAWANVSLEKRDFYSYIQIVATTVVEWLKSEYEVLFLKDGGPFKGQDIENSGELFYEVVSGYKFNKEQAIRPEYIVSDENYYTLDTKLGSEFSKTNENQYLYNSIELDQEQIKQGVSIRNHFLEKKGFRGIVNQTAAKIVEKDGKKIISDASFLGNTAEFKTFKYLDQEQSILQRMDAYENFDLNDYFDDHYKAIIDNDEEEAMKDPNKEIPEKPEDIDWNNFGNQTRVSAYQYHLQQTAKVSGYKANFRKETYIFDSISQIRYRAVILNNRDNMNFTILDGRNALNRGEILLSQQYARANKIKLNDHLRIGDALYKVVGFATDTYSYFPTADPDFPVPQTKTSAIIYAYRDTIRDLTSGISSGQSERSATQSFNFFLTGTENQYKTDVNKFLALQMNVGKSLKSNYEYLNSGTSSEKIKSFFKTVKFADSNFRLSWTLQPLALRVFNIITVIASLVIAIIAIIALIICIKKTIHFNAKQIGILKAIGTNPWMIAVSYIAQSLIIAFIVIPLGWLAGVGMQIPFSSMFISYFSSPYHGFIFEGISLAISFVAFGVLAIIISLVCAFLLTNKSVMDILVVNTKWSSSKLINKLKNGVFKNSKFTLKFSLTLASSGKKPIALLVTVIAFSSILISTGLAIPSVALNAQKSYYKSVKYANAYQNKDTTLNSPLSKPAYSFWEGQDVLEADFIDDKLDMDGTGVGYGYYKTPKNYNSSTFDATPFSKYLYSSGNQTDEFKVQSSFEYLTSNPETIFNTVSDYFGNHFYTVLGQAFSIGMIDQMFAMILNSKESLNPKISDANWNDEAKLAMVRQISSSVTESIPTLIKAVMGSVSGVGPGNSESNNWKQQIIDVLMSEVPPYVKGYIQKESRLEQYSLGYNFEQFIPKKESISTELNVSSDRYNNVGITGLDKSQVAYKLDQESEERAFFDRKTIKALEKVFNSSNPQADASINDIEFNGTKVYDKATNTLTAPVITNQQSRTVYKLKKDQTLTNLETTSKVLQLAKNGIELPKQAWIYNDNDYVNSDYYTNSKIKAIDDSGETRSYADFAKTRTGVIEGEESYLNPFALDNNKFTYSKQYNQVNYGSNKLKDKASMFNDFSYNVDGELQATLIRPYYEYKNLELFIPYSQLENGAGVEMFLNGYSPGNISKHNQWYEKDVPSRNVPKAVQKAWQTEENQNEKYLLVRPFDTSYTLGDVENQGMSNLLSQPKYWFKYALTGDIPALKQGLNIKTNYINKDLIVNIKAVGNMTSYNEKIIVMDSSLANLIGNYSTARKIGIKDTTFDYSTKVPAGEIDQSTGTISDKFDRYKLRDANSKDVLNTNWWELTYMGKQALDYAPLYWHNGKYSNVEEPLGLTSGISYLSAGNTGQYALGLGGNLANNFVESMIESQKLLSTSKDLINQISVLAASIGMLLIIAVIITAALLIMLVGDIYISQYQKFMILMRALGYSNWKVQKYAFGTVTIFGLLVWILATAVTWGLIALGILGIYALGLAVPFGVSWWPPVISFVIIMSSFIGSLVVSSGKIRRGNPSELMTGFGD
ncbi:ABC transporter permease [Mesoplasma syrphidae]|uniref:ABC transporter permease n=1 Tax=Mesoplasma syrphidae TaxID=225999 RepID=A0A2K9BRJ2_9MOLU|nr:ABC transporter permease [Mesoplasma syrphidae]AUF83622.1 ABC transporter permease [Mesoplasma syrphidae]